MKAFLAAIALVALSAAPAYAKMVCHDEPGLGATPDSPPVVNQVCVDNDVLRDQWIAGYCTMHADDQDCVALGYHWLSADPVDQAVDRRLNERFCAAHPSSVRCVSPFKH